MMSNEWVRNDDGSDWNGSLELLPVGRMGRYPTGSRRLAPASDRRSRQVFVVREQASVYEVSAEPLADRADADVLAELVGCTEAVANELLVRYGGVPGLARCSTLKLLAAGLTVGQAKRLRAGLELGRRVPFPPSLPTHIRSPADLAALLPPLPLEQEHVWVVLLTTAHTLIAAETLYIGTIDAAQVRVAEVFRPAVRQNAAAIALAHSQPSGDPTPSSEDVRLTREVLAAGRLLGIAVVDHLVVAGSRWVSLRERVPGLWR